MIYTAFQHALAKIENKVLFRADLFGGNFDGVMAKNELAKLLEALFSVRLFLVGVLKPSRPPGLQVELLLSFEINLSLLP